MDSQALPLVYVFVGLTILFLCLLGVYAVGRLRGREDASATPGLSVASWLFLGAAAVVLLAVRSIVERMGLKEFFSAFTFDLATGFLVAVILGLTFWEGRCALRSRRSRRA